MKQTLASLVLALFLFPSIALGETMDDLVITNGLYYKKYTEVLFTAKTTGREQACPVDTSEETTDGHPGRTRLRRGNHTAAPDRGRRPRRCEVIP